MSSLGFDSLGNNAEVVVVPPEMSSSLSEILSTLTNASAVHPELETDVKTLQSGVQETLIDPFGRNTERTLSSLSSFAERTNLASNVQGGAASALPTTPPAPPASSPQVPAVNTDLAAGIAALQQALTSLITVIGDLAEQRKNTKQSSASSAPKTSTVDTEQSEDIESNTVEDTEAEETRSDNEDTDASTPRSFLNQSNTKKLQPRRESNSKPKIPSEKTPNTSPSNTPSNNPDLGPANQPGPTGPQANPSGAPPVVPPAAEQEPTFTPVKFEDIAQGDSLLNKTVLLTVQDGGVNKEMRVTTKKNTDGSITMWINGKENRADFTIDPSNRFNLFAGIVNPSMLLGDVAASKGVFFDKISGGLGGFGGTATSQTLDSVKVVTNISASNPAIKFAEKSAETILAADPPTSVGSLVSFASRVLKKINGDYSVFQNVNVHLTKGAFKSMAKSFLSGQPFNLNPERDIYIEGLKDALSTLLPIMEEAVNEMTAIDGAWATMPSLIVKTLRSLNIASQADDFSALRSIVSMVNTLTFNKYKTIDIPAPSLNK